MKLPYRRWFRLWLLQLRFVIVPQISIRSGANSSTYLGLNDVREDDIGMCKCMQHNKCSTLYLSWKIREIVVSSSYNPQENETPIRDARQTAHVDEHQCGGLRLIWQ
jgi:hypothetical protein